ncbi:MAG TPA: hypothetical protein VM933_11470 [Acidimicrobiales bacterium]|nr:hypothetical protein [Acidimicrobiales bacterium]
MTDWQRWHDEYDDPDSRLSARLVVVQEFLRRALDRRPPGPIRLLSLCAGEGRDVIGVLRDHPRRDDVRGVLVEADPGLAQRAGDAIAAADLHGQLSVVVGDAGTTDTFTFAVPTDVLLLCGIFGNVGDDDVDYTVRNASRLCDEDAIVIWTRHPRPPDLTVWIRQWFAESGFLEIGFEASEAQGFGVGCHRLIAEPEAFASGLRLFRFVDR